MQILLVLYLDNTLYYIHLKQVMIIVAYYRTSTDLSVNNGKSLLNP